ncbi:STAS/SEC14 domain-containing protein [Sphingobium sp.]|uniref:STAS/SEC14 domain-containing protein n=1 Tax=Sphingobium sp. TaxID=1912891 RepID=UPI003BB73632
MSRAHYSITFRSDIALMDVAWRRYFAPTDVADYAADCFAEFARAGFRPGYLLRMDMSQSAVQPQDALAMFRTHFSGFPVARRIAVVTPSMIARMQVQREMTQPYLQIFAAPDVALAWLLEDVAAPA